MQDALGLHSNDRSHRTKEVALDFRKCLSFNFGACELLLEN
jgi:hypothetical protein